MASFQSPNASLHPNLQDAYDFAWRAVKASDQFRGENGKLSMKLSAILQHLYGQGITEPEKLRSLALEEMFWDKPRHSV